MQNERCRCRLLWQLCSSCEWDLIGPVFCNGSLLRAYSKPFLFRTKLNLSVQCEECGLCTIQAFKKSEVHSQLPSLPIVMKPWVEEIRAHEKKCNFNKTLFGLLLHSGNGNVYSMSWQFPLNCKVFNTIWDLPFSLTLKESADTLERARFHKEPQGFQLLCIAWENFAILQDKMMLQVPLVNVCMIVGQFIAKWGIAWRRPQFGGGRLEILCALSIFSIFFVSPASLPSFSCTSSSSCLFRTPLFNTGCYKRLGQSRDWFQSQFVHSFIPV